MEEQEQDLYAIFNLEKDASAEDLTAAYKRLCMMCHPDKHTDPDLKHAAEEMFPKVQRAYAVLNNPETRMVYDAYGSKGLRAGTDLVQYCTTREEIIAECKASEQLAKERQERQLADANSTVEIALDARPIFDPSDGARELDVEIGEMTLSQSIQTKITERDYVQWGGALVADHGKGAGNASACLKHTFSSDLQGEFEVCAGSNKIGSVSLAKNIEHGFDVRGGLTFFNAVSGSRVGSDLSFVRSLGPMTYGVLQWQHMPGRILMKTGILWNSSDSLVSAFVQLGLPDTHVVLRGESQVTEDIRVHASLKVGVIETRVAYGAERMITDVDNRVGARVRIGSVSGVSLKITYHRLSQTYSLPIALADVVAAETILVATVVPIVAYIALQRLVLDPYLRRVERAQRTEARRRNRAVIQRRRRAAMTEVQLMKETLKRRVEAEARVDGLIIVQALYGQLVASSLDDDHDDDMPLVTDVTIPLQCLVKDSALRLSKGTKANLLGFYDPCPDEPKSLRVRYKVFNQLHETTIDDEADLACPLSWHRIHE